MAAIHIGTFDKAVAHLRWQGFDACDGTNDTFVKTDSDEDGPYQLIARIHRLDGTETVLLEMHEVED